MKAVLQNMKSGELAVQDVPSPALRDGGILVSVHRSLVSLGTDRQVLALARKGPLGKARDRPDLARKVWNKARQEGFWSTAQVVRNLLESPIPLGYSCAGEVLAVGRDAGAFEVGQRVACAGLGFANHAELDFVPRNLAVPLPEDVSYEDGSFVTLGAIAMQGVRLAGIELGDRVVVLGLGLVGQLAAQIARCAGATVIANDLDAGKLELAGSLGAHQLAGSSEELARTVARLTQGQGADAILVCAASKSSGIMARAAQLARLKGRIVILGDVGMHLERRPLFEKEVSVVVSRSYGPGRYDLDYELKGSDYPYAYVRWTEGRNMSAFLELVARREVSVGPLVTHRFPIEEAQAAYELVDGTRKEPAIAIVLSYPGTREATSRVALPRAAQAAPKAGRLRLGVIGAGQFAQGVLLPAFARQPGVELDAFCTASGATSHNVAKRYRARYCTGSAEEIIDDPELDGVVIATRHDQHAHLAGAALRAGKAVFLEKPLAMSEDELARLVDTLAACESPRLMVGFNRRFSPLARQCRDLFEGIRPLFLMYRVNAGALPSDSWALDRTMGGGRIVGEVCHFVDTLAYLTGSPPTRVHAARVENPAGGRQESEAVTVTIHHRDGSVGTVHYLANGDPSVSKEYLEVFGGQTTAILDNYRSLAMHQRNRRRVKRLLNQAKGHREEVQAFVEALRAGGPMPIDLDLLVAVTQSTFLIERSLETGTPIEYAAPHALDAPHPPSDA